MNLMLEGLPDSVKHDRQVWNTARHTAEEAKKQLTERTDTVLELNLQQRSISRRLTRAQLE